MAVNLCQPHFHTTAHCNKLCADGYDVTNLVSAEPALRKRGFKLEYFVRPPLQVTLKFDFPVELCRVDVELWPWGMDRGQACKKLEISTSSDPCSPPGFTQQHEKNKQKQDVSKSNQSDGHQWSLQAQQWDEDKSQQRDRLSHESNNFQSDFKLVARCELREETQVSFKHLQFRPRPPFLSHPPPEPANCRQEKLWSRGLSSLGTVTQLRVTVPFGGAASSLGLKALAVWGQPARCCPAEEVERIKRIHEATERRMMQPAFFSPSVRQTAQTLQAPESVSIPEEFLDPITQEVMMLPMLLPSGVSVDNNTLEEYQKREAGWGRQPNDPFTGVPFTATSQPLPNPQLKSRIDHFLLQKGVMGRDGMLGRRDQGQNPQASRLITSVIHEQSQISPHVTETSTNSSSVQSTTDNTDTSRTSDTGSSSSNDVKDRSDTKPLTTACESDLNRQKKRHLNEINKESTEKTENELPQSKRQRNHSAPVSNCSSHEQVLSASLDEALLCALKGRPSFTSNILQQNDGASDSTEQCQSSGFKNTSTGGRVCAVCSCSLSAYSTSASPVYHLICGHLLCRGCLQRESKQDSATVSGRILCPTCRSLTPRSNITRVHH